MAGNQSTLNDLQDMQAAVNAATAVADSAAQTAANAAAAANNAINGQVAMYRNGDILATGENCNSMRQSGTYALYLPVAVPTEVTGRAVLTVDSDGSQSYVVQRITNTNGNLDGDTWVRVGYDGTGGFAMSDWKRDWNEFNSIVDVDGFIKAV